MALSRILCKETARQVISRGWASGGPGHGPARWKSRRTCSVCRGPTASRIGETEGAGLLHEHGQGCEITLPIAVLLEGTIVCLSPNRQLRCTLLLM